MRREANADRDRESCCGTGAVVRMLHRESDRGAKGENALNTESAITAVVLGWNHAGDTIECCRSLLRSEGVGLRLLYVDNGSREEEVRAVLDGVPEAEVVRHEQNVGVSRGFNAGLARALQAGAEFVFMANNDTLFQPDALRRLLDAAREHPEAGILVPKINHHEPPDVLWSAGSRFRRFPPAIVMNRTPGPDDGRHDSRTELEFTTLCTVLVRGEALKRSGLMNPNFLFYCEDYDLALRVREAGFTIRLVPGAGTCHKVERVTRAGRASPLFWSNGGRSEAVFARLHRRHPWLAGPVHAAYVAARAFYEGGWDAGRLFLQGWREGRRADMRPVPDWKDGPFDPVVVVREGPGAAAPRPEAERGEDRA